MSHNNLYSTGWSRAPEIRGGALVALGADGTNDPSTISTTAPTGMIPTMSMRGMRIRALGDTDTDVLDMVVFSVDVDNDFKPTVFTTTELGTLIWITGPLVNPKHAYWNPLGGVELFADIVTSWTPTAAGTALFSYADGAVVTSSPANNLIAEMLIPDLGNIHGILLRFELGTATATGGAMFKLDI